VTLGHIRSHDCRDLLVYCISGRCYHSATLSGDWSPNETPVRSLCLRMVWHADHPAPIHEPITQSKGERVKLI
jgi:hypothetical protein